MNTTSSSMRSNTTVAQPKAFAPISLLVQGLAIWVAGTLPIRLIGQFIFSPSSLVFFALIYLVLGPVMFMATRWLLHLNRVSKADKYKAITYLVLPPMLLDSLSLVFFSFCFPNLPVDGAIYYPALLLWVYFWNLAAPGSYKGYKGL